MLAAVVASICDAAAERRVALVIGNSQYKSPGLALANPKNDAEDIAATLRGPGFDFDVIQAIDASKNEIERALANFARAARDSDSALFYYAGHAMQYQGLNYLMPVDTELEDEYSLRYEMVALDKVREAIDGANGMRIVILDACRNNPLSDRLTRNLTGGRTRALVSTRGLARIDKTEGMLIAYATAADDVAIDGTSGRNSPFTRALLRRMQEPGREIKSMFQQITVDVREETRNRQRPEVNFSLTEDYFINRNDRLVWEKLRETNDIPAIREFMERYPYSSLIPHAQKLLNDLERSARERDEQKRLKAERERADRAEQAAREAKQQIEDLRRKQAEDEKRRAAEEAARKVEEAARAAEAEKRRAEEAGRIAAIEAEQQGIAAEQARRRAEAERKAREEAAGKQDEAGKGASEHAERQRREEAAEEARKNKEAADRLTKLEEERLRAKREQEQQEAAQKFAQQQRELTCRRERAAYGVIDSDLSKLSSFVTTSACDEVRAKANERIAALTTQAQTCKSESDILETLKGIDPGKRDQLVKFEQEITCEKLRPAARQLLAKLDADAQTQLIRNTQIALRAIGCFAGPDTGKVNDATRTAIKRYRSKTEGDEANLAITPELLNEVKAHEPHTCPLACPTGQVIHDDTCVAKIESKPPVQARRPAHEKQANRPARERPRPVVHERLASPPPAPRQEATKSPGSPRALGVGF